MQEHTDAYRYETHLHTSITSACSRFTPEEIVDKYSRLGYAGIFVTDHFLNGNTTVPRDLSWERRVTRFCAGYRLAKKAAEGKFDVFFGFEYSYKGTDFLVYGLSEEWLLAHPEIMEMRVTQFAPFARSEGALVVQAHPYREANYIDHIRLFPSVVDGVEVFNATMHESTNRLAEILANAYGLKMTAGSDIHGKGQETLGGVAFREKIKSERDFIDKIKRGEGSIFTLTDKGVL